MKILQSIEKSFLGTIARPIGRHILNPVGEFSVWKDYSKTCSDAAFIRDGKFKVDSAKTVLIALASDMVYEAKLLAMLALGFKMQGFEVAALFPRSYFWAPRYLKAFGIDKFMHLEDLEFGKHDYERCRKEARNIMSREMNFTAFKELRYRGARIGPQIISSVCRSTMQGAPDLKDPAIRGKIADLLPETVEAVDKAGKLFEKFNIQTLIVVESNYAMMAALVDTAIQKGVNVIQAVQPWRDDALIFKRLTPETRRYHPNSVSLSTLKQFETAEWTEKQERELDKQLLDRYGGKWFLQSRNQPNVKKKTKEDIIRQLGLDEGKKTAVVFSHVLWDANLFFGEDLFEDYGDWFVQTVKAACANKNANWIIKLHPSNVWKRSRENITEEFAEITLIKKEIGDLPPHVKLLYPNTDINTWSLFEFADYGVTVRGTIGMELSCLGVPVFTAGTGRYSNLGFTFDSATKEEYLEKLSRIQDFERMTDEQTLLAKKHAYMVFCLRPWIMKSFKAEFNYKKKGLHPLDHNLLFNAKSFEEIELNADLKKWAQWASDKKSIDYLERPFD